MAQKGALPVLLCGEVFNLEAFDDLDPKPDSAAMLLLCLAKLDRLDRLAGVNGQFCAAVYDQGAHRLSLVTDRLATFPLHYWQNSEDLVFATQLFSLIANPRVPPAPVAEAVAEAAVRGRSGAEGRPGSY